MIIPTLIDLNPVELIYYSFIISLDEFNGGSDMVDDVSMKICVLSKTKGVNTKLFNMITRINEVKTLVKHIKCKFNSTKYNSNQKWNNDKCQGECIMMNGVWWNNKIHE